MLLLDLVNFNTSGFFPLVAVFEKQKKLALGCQLAVPIITHFPANEWPTHAVRPCSDSRRLIEILPPMPNRADRLAAVSAAALVNQIG